MFGKVAFLIVCAGLCACALLAVRQMRTQAAYEMAQARLRAVRVDEDVARVRAIISARVNPERVLEMAARLNPLKPFAAERGPRPAQRPSTQVATHRTPERRR